VETKIKNARRIIEEAIGNHKRIAVACSFGKDSMVTVHLAREVDPNIQIFAIMTQYKPIETLEYLRKMNEMMNLNTTVYMVAGSVPPALQNSDLKVELLPAAEFEATASRIKAQTGKEIYAADPDECCRLLKVDPTKVAVNNLDAWICGLRNTEGRTREDYQEVEHKGGLVKINPILTFEEAEVWQYMSTKGIEPHSWYQRGYRSLGCAPCSNPGGELERDGRWQNTSKCGGECGIHTQALK
jgi:phosphoadenosine phosphosulfate reductase